MKFLFFPFIAILMMSCPSQENQTPLANNFPGDTAGDYSDSSLPMQPVTLEGEWVLIPVLPSDTAAGLLPLLNFDLNTKTFSGNSGCNQMRGKFFLDRDSLVFLKDIALTKMACPGYNEKIFLENLLKVNNFEIENGVLQLMTNKTVLSKWKREGAIKEKTI